MILTLTLDGGINDQSKNPLADARFLEKVETVQKHQADALRRLVQRHGLRQVLIERLTEKTTLDFELMLAVLQEDEKTLPKMRKAKAKLTTDAKTATDAGHKAKVLLRQIDKYLAGHRERLLIVGAAGGAGGVKDARRLAIGFGRVVGQSQADYQGWEDSFRRQAD